WKRPSPSSAGGCQDRQEPTGAAESAGPPSATLGARRVAPGVGRPVIRRQLAVLRRRRVAAEESAEQPVQVVRPAEVVLHAFEHPGHELLELGIVGELLLEAAEL